jgi:SAM-dependent methyltransferase
MGYGSGLPRWFPTLTYQCNPRCEQLATGTRAGAVVLDLGAGGRRIAPNVTTIDVQPFADTDVVANVYQLPFADESSDLVFATGLLEHLEDERDFLREARRVLKTGGVLHVEMPFLQQYHEDPIDCRRYTVPGLKLLLELNGFRARDSGFHIGPSVTFFTIASYYAGLLFEGETVFHKAISNLAFLVVSCIGYPLKHLDSFLKRKRSAHRLAFGVYCTATKVGQPDRQVAWPPARRCQGRGDADCRTEIRSTS